MRVRFRRHLPERCEKNFEKSSFLKKLSYLCAHFTEAQVAKLVDALLSGGSARNGVSVRL